MIRDPAVTSRIMAAVRSTGTRPEMTLRRALFRRGLRYRVRTTLPGKPDVVFPGARVACFVDGAFWHGGGWKERGYTSMESQFEGHRVATGGLPKSGAMSNGTGESLAPSRRMAGRSCASGTPR